MIRRRPEPPKPTPPPTPSALELVDLDLSDAKEARDRAIEALDVDGFCRMVGEIDRLLEKRFAAGQS